MKRIVLFMFAFVLLLVGGVSLKEATFNNGNSLVTSAEETIEYQDDSIKEVANIEKEEEKTEEDSMELCVIGNASKNVAPDRATVTAVIETLDLDITKSKDLNFEAFNKVVKALGDEELDTSKVVIDSYTSYPSYDYNAGKTLIGYYSITTFSFDVEKLEDVKKFIDSATENGVTSVRNVTYKVSNIDDIYADVLLSALENAKAKAQKISGRDDLQVKSIKEEYVYSCTSLYKSYADGLGDNSMIGNVNVQAKVAVEFA